MHKNKIIDFFTSQKYLKKKKDFKIREEKNVVLVTYLEGNDYVQIEASLDKSSNDNVSIKIKKFYYDTLIKNRIFLDHKDFKDKPFSRKEIEIPYDSETLKKELGFT